MADSRSRLVAATTRTSTGTSSRPPTGPHGALLEHAQELGLQAERHVADLVEEERAAVRAAGRARASAVFASVKAPLRVAEELALEEALGHRGAVDGDEGALARRRLRSWIARATSSLPVPLSPVTSTVASDRATRSMRS